MQAMQKINRSIPAKRLAHRDRWTNQDIAHASGTSQATANSVLNGHMHNTRVEAALRLMYPDLSDLEIFGELRADA
jgi:hypothetical protein